MGGLYYTHTTEVRALKAQLSALKSSTLAVLAPATPAPMAAAATAAPATAAQTGSTPTKAVPSKPAAGRYISTDRKYANEGSAMKAGSGQEAAGRNRAKTPVQGRSLITACL